MWVLWSAIVVFSQSEPQVKAPGIRHTIFTATTFSLRMFNGPFFWRKVAVLGSWPSPVISKCLGRRCSQLLQVGLVKVISWYKYWYSSQSKVHMFMSCSCHVHIIHISISFADHPAPLGNQRRPLTWGVQVMGLGPRSAGHFFEGKMVGPNFWDAGPLIIQATYHILLMGPGLLGETVHHERLVETDVQIFWCPFFFQVNISWNWVSIYIRGTFSIWKGPPKFHSLIPYYEGFSREWFPERWRIYQIGSFVGVDPQIPTIWDHLGVSLSPNENCRHFQVAPLNFPLQEDNENSDVDNECLMSNSISSCRKSWYIIIEVS